MTTVIEAGTPTVDAPADSLPVPIRETMLEKFLTGGIDRKLCAGELATLIFAAVGLYNPWVLLAFPPTYPILRFVTRRGPGRFSCCLRHSK